MLIRTPTSPFRAVYAQARTQPALADAIASAVPDVADLGEQIERLTSSAADVAPPQDDGTLRADLTGRLAAGDGVPVDLIARVGDVAAQRVAAAQTRDLLESVATQLSDARDSALRSGADAILSTLHERLRALVADAGRVLRDVPPSAEAALAAGAGEQWEAARLAREQYVALRRAQSVIVRAVWPEEMWSRGASWFPVLAYIADPEAAWPEALAGITRGYREDEHGNVVQLPKPWPDLASPEALSWLVAHPDARPWVPTAKQYTAAYDRHHAAASGVTNPARRARLTVPMSRGTTYL